MNDVAELCRVARDAGALSIVDGAHAPGQIELDLEALGADVYTGNCHKWLCNLRPSAFLYARPEVQDIFEPLVISWDWRDGASFPERHRWQGTLNPCAYLTIPNAIDFQAEHNWPAVRQSVSRPARSRRLRPRATDGRLRADARLPRRAPRSAGAQAAPLRRASNRSADFRVAETTGYCACLVQGVQRRVRPGSATRRSCCRVVIRH